MTVVKTLRKLLAMSLMAVVTQACAAPMVKEEKPEQPRDFEVNFKLDSKGVPTPYTRDGKPFAECSQDSKRDECVIFKKDAQLKDVETIVINQFTSQINPTCVVYSVIIAGQKHYFFNPDDPNCAKFNR